MSLDRLKQVVAQFWGYRTLRPLQEQAMSAVLQSRDSLVVLPTGAGKSLCYQAPPVSRGDTTVVISPLISLMKDQVDTLRSNGVPAGQIDSTQSAETRSAFEFDLLQGELRLLFVSPERLQMPGFQALLRRAGVRTFAIDEAHCISHWGHDFRPEYRQLKNLKTLFPEANVHAYTATATERVRRDIINELGLRDPVVLVGNFDRPNLTYRVLPRRDQIDQVREVLARHQGEAGIIYCIRRKDVDELTDALRRLGVNALAYHAGLSQDQREAAQDAFAAERCDLIVATVAFGMGIDRSNIRFVLHNSMPKSIEHYQQETGRAGRDGLEAECVLLHSGVDFLTWKSIAEKSGREAGVGPDVIASAVKHLSDIDNYCRGAVCRHRALVNYFGQPYEPANCAACDICLGDAEQVADAVVVAQKILSCVARVKEGFGVTHVVSVLRGEDTENVRKRGHEKLSTYGLLKEHGKADVRDWVYQLIGQNLLTQTGDEYPVLKLTPASWDVMRGQKDGVRLMQPRRRGQGERPQKSKADDVSWEGVDRALFDLLRERRRTLAAEEKKPPYVIFGDATLRELARVRPTGREQMRQIYGVGDAKLAAFGDIFLDLIRGECAARGLATDQPGEPPRSAEPKKPSTRANPHRDQAFAIFRKGGSIGQAMTATGRTRTTVIDYLVEFIRAERPSDIEIWVDDEVVRQVEGAVKTTGNARLKPIFLALKEAVPYDDIRIALACLAVESDLTPGESAEIE